MIIKLIGLVLQIVGIAIVLISQAIFILRAWKRYSSLKKAFLSLSFPIVGMEEEEIERLSKTELEEIFKEAQLAMFLYDDFKISVIGLVFTLIGTIVFLF
jgi:hypothetical protein